MSTPATTPVIPSPEEVDAAVYLAYVAEGYAGDTGVIDTQMLRQRIFEVLAPRKVQHKNQRAERAVTRGELTRAVFPGLPAPDDFEDQDNPVLARMTWDKIYQAVWSQVRPGASGALQRMVGYALGNGYVLCRTQIGDDKTQAAYITDDYECIQLDYISPDMAALDKLATRILAAREMLIMRQPENAQRYAKSFSAGMKAIQNAGADRLRLAIEASKPAEDEAEDEAADESPEE